VGKPAFGTKAFAAFATAIPPRKNPCYALLYATPGNAEVNNIMTAFVVALQLATYAVRTCFGFDKNVLIGLRRHLLPSCRLVNRFELRMCPNENFLSLIVKVSRLVNVLQVFKGEWL
jgi:hypothetical protein